MRKRTGLWIAVILLIVFLAGCFVYFFLMTPWEHFDVNINAKIEINGERIKEKGCIYRYGSTDPLMTSIPLFGVLRGFGYSVAVQDDGNTAVIDTGEEKYILREGKLFKDEEPICLVPYYLSSLNQRYPEEKYMESEDLIHVLARLGIPNVNITLDTERKRIIISQTE